VNVPSYNVKRLSFGPGILYLGAAGTTPTTDVGAVRAGATLAFTREKLEIKQGSPEQLIQQYVTAETVRLEVHGIEWNLENLRYALGAGEISSISGGQQMDFGGDMTITNCSVKFVHQMPAGGTVEVDIWKAQGQGEIEITFGMDPHEFPYVFLALVADTDWAGNTLPANGRLCRIKLLGDFS